MPPQLRLEWTDNSSNEKGFQVWRRTEPGGTYAQIAASALQPEDIQPALSAGVTIDHVFSISAALVGGVIWSRYGYQYVFFFGVLIALANLAAALRIQVPAQMPLPAMCEAPAEGLKI